MASTAKRSTDGREPAQPLVKVWARTRTAGPYVARKVRVAWPPNSDGLTLTITAEPDEHLEPRIIETTITGGDVNLKQLQRLKLPARKRQVLGLVLRERTAPKKTSFTIAEFRDHLLGPDEREDGRRVYSDDDLRRAAAAYLSAKPRERTDAVVKALGLTGNASQKARDVVRHGCRRRIDPNTGKPFLQ